MEKAIACRDPQKAELLNRAGNVFAAIWLQGDFQAAQPKLVLNLVMCCDLDSEDYNGAIHNLIVKAIHSKVPLIAPKSLLSRIDDEEGARSEFLSLATTIAKNADEWDFYTLSEFVFCFPKNYPYSMEKLFNCHCFTKVTHWSEAFEGPQRRVGAQDLNNLMTVFAHLRLRIIFYGHGETTYVSGLTKTHFKNFFDQLVKLDCVDYLELRGCMGGSATSLGHTTTQDGRAVTPKFPVMIRSIGAFITNASGITEDLTSYFAQIEESLKRGMQRRSCAKAIQAGESPKKPYHNHYLIQIPQGLAQTTIGFRSVNEFNQAEVITKRWIDETVKDLQPTLRFRGQPKRPSASQTVNLPMMYQVYPIVLERAIVMRPVTLQTSASKEAPFFLSMIPGNAHHILGHLILKEISFRNFYEKACRLGKECSEHKAYFIAHVDEEWVDAQGMHHVTRYDQVVLDLYKDRNCCYYARGTPAIYYRYHHGQNPAEEVISAETYAFEVMQILYDTDTNPEALRRATEGTQTEKMFYKVFEDLFLNTQAFQAAHDVSAVFHYFKIVNPSMDDRIRLFRSLKPYNHHFVLCIAFQFKDWVLIDWLLEKGSIDVNRKNCEGDTLVNLATRANQKELVRRLVCMGANLKEKGSHGFTPLHLAACGRDEIFEMLFLNYSDRIDVDIPDNKGWTALQFSACYSSIYTFYKVMNLNKGNLNHVTQKGWTVLSYMARNEDPAKMKDLFVWNADPYAGNPCALSQAIRSRRKNAVEYLLFEKRVDPIKPRPSGCIPLHEAAERGTPEIIRLLTSYYKYTPQQLGEATIKAIMWGSQANAQCLIECGADLSIKDSKGRHLISLALKHFHVGTLRAIVRAGGNQIHDSRAGDGSI